MNCVKCKAKVGSTKQNTPWLCIICTNKLVTELWARDFFREERTLDNQVTNVVYWAMKAFERGPEYDENHGMFKVWPEA